MTNGQPLPATCTPPRPVHSLGQVLVLVTGILLMRNSEALLPAGEPSVGEYCKRADHEDDYIRCSWWRVMLVVGIVPDLIAVVIIFLYLPESPRYLLCQGKTEEVTMMCCQCTK